MFDETSASLDTIRELFAAPIVPFDEIRALFELISAWFDCIAALFDEPIAEFDCMSALFETINAVLEVILEEHVAEHANTLLSGASSKSVRKMHRDAAVGLILI